jgi:hypothetical protein
MTIYFGSVNRRLHAKMRGSSPQRVASHLPNIATLCRGMHFSNVVPETTSSESSEVLSPVLPLNCLGEQDLFHGICHHHHFFCWTCTLSGGGVVKNCSRCTLVIMMKKMDGSSRSLSKWWIHSSVWQTYSTHLGILNCHFDEVRFFSVFINLWHNKLIHR